MDALSNCFHLWPVTTDHAPERNILRECTWPPCDVHPQFGDAEGHLRISRTYVGNRNDSASTLRMECMQSRLVESSKAFKTPQLILEDVARLEKAVLLSLDLVFDDRYFMASNELNLLNTLLLS